MKKILFVAGITVLGLSAAFAQDLKQTPAPNTSTSKAVARPTTTRATPETIAKVRTNRLTKALSLTEDQQKKVYDVFLKQSQQNQGRGVQSKAIDEQLTPIFTAEQNKKYEAMKSDRTEMMMQRTNTRSTLEAAPAGK